MRQTRFLLILVLSIGLLSGCWFSQDDTPKVPKAPEAQSGTVLQPSDTAQCMMLIDPIHQRECLENFAKRSPLSVADCATLADPLQKQGCEFSVIQMQAQTAKDHTLCKNLSDPQDSLRCEQMVANEIVAQTRDPAFCKTLSNSGVIDSCLNIIKMKKAEETGDVTACNWVIPKDVQENNPMLLNSCKDSISMRYAENKKDPKLCMAIRDVSMIDRCILQLDPKAAAARKAHIFSRCDSIPDKPQKDLCLKQEKLSAILNSWDVKQCDKLPAPEQKICKTSMAMKKAIDSGKVENCSTLDAERKSACTDSIRMNANTNWDQAFCETLTSSNARLHCQQNIKK